MFCFAYEYPIKCVGLYLDSILFLWYVSPLSHQYGFFSSLQLYNHHATIHGIRNKAVLAFQLCSSLSRKFYFCFSYSRRWGFQILELVCWVLQKKKKKNSFNIPTFFCLWILHLLILTPALCFTSSLVACSTCFRTQPRILVQENSSSPTHPQAV